MKQYQAQVRLSYYVWVDVEAPDEHSKQNTSGCTNIINEVTT